MANKFTSITSGGNTIPVWDKDAHSALNDKLDTTAFSTVSGTFLTEHQSLDGYATEQWVEDKGYLTEHQDIPNSANWNSTYNTVSSNSAQWGQGGGGSTYTSPSGTLLVDNNNHTLESTTSAIEVTQQESIKKDINGFNATAGVSAICTTDPTKITRLEVGSIDYPQVNLNILDGNNDIVYRVSAAAFNTGFLGNIEGGTISLSADNNGYYYGKINVKEITNNYRNVDLVTTEQLASATQPGTDAFSALSSNSGTWNNFSATKQDKVTTATSGDYKIADLDPLKIAYITAGGGGEEWNYSSEGFTFSPWNPDPKTVSPDWRTTGGNTYTIEISTSGLNWDTGARTFKVGYGTNTGSFSSVGTLTNIGNGIATGLFTIDSNVWEGAGDVRFYVAGAQQPLTAAMTATTIVGGASNTVSYLAPEPPSSGSYMLCSNDKTMSWNTPSYKHSFVTRETQACGYIPASHSTMFIGAANIGEPEASEINMTWNLFGLLPQNALTLKENEKLEFRIKEMFWANTNLNEIYFGLAKFTGSGMGTVGTAGPFQEGNFDVISKPMPPRSFEGMTSGYEEGQNPLIFEIKKDVKFNPNDKIYVMMGVSGNYGDQIQLFGSSIYLTYDGYSTVPWARESDHLGLCTIIDGNFISPISGITGEDFKAVTGPNPTASNLLTFRPGGSIEGWQWDGSTSSFTNTIITAYNAQFLSLVQV